MEKLPSWLQIISILGGAVGFIAAFLVGFKKWRKEDNSENIATKNDLILTLEKALEHERETSRSTQEQLKNNQEYHHTKATEAQAIVNRLTAENAEYRAKTDITPVLTFIEQQTEMNKKTMAILQTIADKLK